MSKIREIKLFLIEWITTLSENITEHFDETVECSVAFLGDIGGKFQRIGVLGLGMSYTWAVTSEWCFSTEKASQKERDTNVS